MVSLRPGCVIVYVVQDYAGLAKRESHFFNQMNSLILHNAAYSLYMFNLFWGDYGHFKNAQYTHF